MTVRMAVLVSGGGTNLQALLRAEASGALAGGHIALVVASKEGVYALERAKNAGVPTAVAAPAAYASEAAYEAALSAVLEQHGVAAIVLAGYTHILSADFVARYENRIINVHPSLVPAFCGRGYYGLRVHEAVLAAGVRVTGATVHLVSDVPDRGRILLQQAVAVRADDTPQTLQRRVMEEAEWRLLPQAAAHLCRCIADGVAVTPPHAATEPAHLPMLLASNRYPGRGIAVGVTPDGRQAVAYFIMGRSPNSRDRVFRRQGDALTIARFTPDAQGDPALVVYSPVRVAGAVTVVSNGDQTDTIFDALQSGGTFASALSTRTFEPDAPHFTPRISGVTGTDGYALSILKAGDGSGGACCRQFFHYEPQRGVGHFIHTYRGDGQPLLPFSGEPRPVHIPDDIGAFTRELWRSLDGENRVALYVRYIAPDGRYEDRIVNRHEGGDL